MDNSMRLFIEEKVNKRINGYRNEHELIGSEYARENELGRSYKGREILELIQNAEDELTENQPKEIFIAFDGENLSIANYGEPFSEEGISSLMYSNTSNKKNRKKKVIGNKGTGFRSILGWADEIKIDSADLHIKFSHKYAQKILKEEVFKGVPLPNRMKAATLVFPEWEEGRIEKKYTTLISIRIKKDETVSEDIKEQLENLNTNLLLFLNRTKKLTVNIEGVTSVYEKTIIDNDKVQLTKKVNGELVYKKEWFLNKKDGVIGEENYSIVIAYDMSGEIPDEPYIYTYFQTDVRFPFPVLLHADLNLNGDRNHLNKNDPSNKKILENAAELLVDTAIKIFDKGVSYNRITFLIPKSDYERELESYNFGNMLTKKMMEAKIFPTVNSKYVVYSADLKFYKSGLAKYLSGKDFSDLLMYSDNRCIQSILEKLGCSKYLYYDIVAKINRWVKSRKPTDENIRKIAYTAIQFLDEFKGTLEFNHFKEQRPSFFFNLDRKLISQGASIFLLDEEYEVSKPPKFVNIEFMDPYMRNYFYKRLKDKDDRDTDAEIIIDKLGDYNVREYNTHELMYHINYIMRTKLEEGKAKDVRERWKTLIKWLWNNRKLFIDKIEDISTYFLNRDKTLVSSYELYYGAEYGNELGEKLIGDISPEHMICNLKNYIECKDDKELVEFIRLFGVSDLPKMKEKKFIDNASYGSNRWSPYIRKLFSYLKFPVTLDNITVFNNLDVFCASVNKVEFMRTEIDLLEEILNRGDTSTIIKWIQSDTRLQNHLYTQLETSAASVQIIWGDRRSPRPLVTLKRAYSHIYHLFSTIAWIQVGGKRYSISDCLLSFDSHGIDISDYLVEPAISEYIRDINGRKGIIKQDFQSIFEKLGVKRDFSELPIKKIYSILNYLPNVEGSEDLARVIYNSIIDNAYIDYSDAELDCEEYIKYIKKGKILTNNGYQPIGNSYYLDGKDVCEKIAKTYNLITIPKKRSKQRIKKLFGVDKLILNGNIVEKPRLHPEYNLFVCDIKQFKVLALAYRIGRVADIRKEAKQFREIEIRICTNIRASYKTEKDSTAKEIELDDYEYILDGKSTYYLKIPEYIEFKDMKHNILLATAVANIFSSYLDVSEIASRYRELYYVGNNDDRQSLVEQEFEDESIVQKSMELLSFDEDIRETFVGIISRLTDKPENEFTSGIEKIDFDDFTAEYNVKPIIEIFRAAEINVSDFNSEMPSISLDFTEHFEKEIQGKLPKFRDNYKLTWYYRLRNKSLLEKLNLVSNFLLFETTKIRVSNDINFNCDKAIIDQLEIDINVKPLDLVALYNKALSTWKSRQTDLKYIDDFLTKPENSSLLYYEEFDELSNRYNSYCAKYATDGDLDTSNESALIEQKVEVYVANAIPTKVDKRKINARTTTGFALNSPRKELERIGLQGEQIVYKYLMENDNISQVNWVSENAKKMGVNPEGGAGCGYDIEFVDANGYRKYVEVKAAKKSKEYGIRFYMSDFEFEFGRKHAEDYMVYYVCNVKSEHPQILIFDNVFKNKEFNKKNFGVEISSEYRITAQADI